MSDILNRFKEQLAKTTAEIKQTKISATRELIGTQGEEIAKAISPFLEELASSSTKDKNEMRDLVSELRAEATSRSYQITDNSAIVDAIERAFGGVYIPEPKVSVNIGKAEILEIASRIKMPDEMNVRGWVSLMGVSMDNPLPVQLRDHKGNPMNLMDNMTQIINSGGNGGAKIVRISGFTQSAFSEITNPDGRLKVELPTGSSGLTDTELRAAHLDVQQVSGSVDSVFITGASGTLAANIVDSSGVAYSGSNPVPVVFGSSATSASNIVDSSGVAYSGSNPVPVTGTVVVSSITATTAVANTDSSGVQYSGSNPFPMTLATGSNVTIAALNVDSSGVGYSGTNPLPITWVSGAGVSTAVTIQDSSGVGYSGGNPFPITVVTSATATVNTAITDSSGIQYSGSNPVPITWVSGAGVSTAVTIQDSSGVGYSGSNPFPITIVTSATATVNAALTDSSGVQYSGGNPVPITGAVTLSGSLTSTVVTGAVVSDGIDDGSAPIKVGAIARQANPTAVSGGDTVSLSADDLGRQVIRPIQVRDLTQTAYVQLTTGTETTLLAGVASTFLDLIHIVGANNSDAAVSVDIRSGTAGSVLLTLQIPASGTAGISCNVPIPQEIVAGAWTADMPDITGTTVSISALFSKEV